MPSGYPALAEPLSFRRGAASVGRYSVEMKTYAAVFFSVFLAELGDKTQLATLLYAADPGASKAGVFVAAAGALVLSTLLAVTIGSEIGRWVAPHLLKTVAGVGFLAVGIWVLLTR